MMNLSLTICYTVVLWSKQVLCNVNDGTMINFQEDQILLSMSRTEILVKLFKSPIFILDFATLIFPCCDVRYNLRMKNYVHFVFTSSYL